MAKYSIQDTSLIAIGDAIRNKTGEHTRPGTYMETIPEVIVSKTPNATGFETHNGGYPTDQNTIIDVIRFPGASGIRVDFSYQTQSVSLEGVRLVSGEYDVLDFPSGHTNYSGNDYYIHKEQLTFQNTDVITIKFMARYDTEYLGYYAECRALDADGNLMGEYQIEVEGEVKNTFTPAQMATEIEGLSTIPEEGLFITGNCPYRFAYNGWNWLIEQHGDKIVTKDISNVESMFTNSTYLKQIPFDINITDNVSSFSNIFAGSAIEEVPYIKGKLKTPTANYTNNPTMNNFFSNCTRLRYIPDDFFDQFGGDEFWAAAQTFSTQRNNIFNTCCSLRKIPSSYAKLMNSNTSSYSHLYYNLFASCYAIDEIPIVPIEPSTTYTSNMFSYTFQSVGRVHTILFETNEDGSPIAVNWKSQTIDLSLGVGYLSSQSHITIYNSGITLDTHVSTTDEYQALKDHPDMWTTNASYSRYNRDSAVATINSLPDTTQSGGTNTIKFKGIAGISTVGGAINDLTEEEIAVAAAKGWTVALV